MKPTVRIALAVPVPQQHARLFRDIRFQEFRLVRVDVVPAECRAVREEEIGRTG